MRMNPPPGKANNSPCQDDVSVNTAMRVVYDHYFASLDYDKRYSKPNQSTLAFLLDKGGREARHILDFGCGSGRYALALLQETSATLTGYDISKSALAEFQNHLDQSGLAGRARLVLDEADALQAAGADYDLIMLLFGVLSHVGVREARLTTLKQLRSLIANDGQLVLTVPSRWRRRPVEQMRAAINRWRKRSPAVLDEPGNIFFSRKLGGQTHQFFYHLYTISGLRRELADAGFCITALEAESALPEWLITQHHWIGTADAWLSRLLPAALGYGIRVVAVPA